MDVYYVLELNSPTVLLDEFSGDPAIVFKNLLNDLKLFCRLFGFKIVSQDSRWGNESEISYYSREAYLCIVIGRKIGSGELGWIMPATQGFAHFKKLKIVKEVVNAK